MECGARRPGVHQALCGWSPCLGGYTPKLDRGNQGGGGAHLPIGNARPLCTARAFLILLRWPRSTIGGGGVASTLITPPPPTCTPARLGATPSTTTTNGRGGRKGIYPKASNILKALSHEKNFPMAFECVGGGGVPRK